MENQKGSKWTPDGKRYQTIVPDTLDLVERADLAINALTGRINAKQDYEVMWINHFAPPSVFHHALEWFDGNPRTLESLTLMRIITGSNCNLELEEAMFRAMLSRIGEDGFLYNAPYREDAPWRRGGCGCRPKQWRTDEDVTEINAQAQFLVALIDRYQRDGDPFLLDTARRMADGMSRVAIHKDDYAYYPATNDIGLEFAYFKHSGWPDTREAADELDSAEGTVSCYIGGCVRALSRWYALTGDTKALETARRLVNYMLKPQFWMGTIESWGESSVWVWHGGRQRKPAALFQGHMSGLAYTFQGLIEYALVANDAFLKEFVRQGYEYMRNLGLVRLGMYGENIANSLMAAVAIKLSDAGVGDYWEDVDQHIRNAMVEDQYTDADLLRQSCREKGVPDENGEFTIEKAADTAIPVTAACRSSEFTIERFLGSLRHDGLIDDIGTLDPTQNGTMASHYLEPLYYVWEGITRCKDGTAQINLLLNRAAPWLDIDSFLPYKGKVVVKNKTAATISLRIPRWVDRSQVKCHISELPVAPAWVGNYLVWNGLHGSEAITVEFPMVESIEHYTLPPLGSNPTWFKDEGGLPQYVLHFKGNTCIKAEFNNRDAFIKRSHQNGYPVYQREHYRGNKAPLKEVTRYIAPKLVEW